MRAPDLTRGEKRGEIVELNIHDLPPIIEKIGKRLLHLLREFEEENSEEATEYLKTCFSKRNCPKIDYESFGTTFTYKYFLENFLKAAATFKVHPPAGQTIVDLGCGSGAVTLAFLAMLDSKRTTQSLVKVYFVDSSQRQLDLARKILESVSKEFRHLIISSHFQRKSIQEWKPDEKDIDVILLGHVLNENRRKISSLLEKTFSATSDEGRIYVIERKNDPVWKIIRKYVSKMMVPSDYGTAKVEVTSKNDPRRMILPENIAVSNSACFETGFLVIYTIEKQSIRLLRLYFDAWSTQSIDLLERVFASDAVYYAKPFNKPYRGIEQIKEYWEKNVLNQENIRIKILRVAYGTDAAFAEWRAGFAQHKLKIKLKGTLVLIFDCNCQKVIELREYYTSRKSAM